MYRVSVTFTNRNVDSDKGESSLSRRNGTPSQREHKTGVGVKELTKNEIPGKNVTGRPTWERSVNKLFTPTSRTTHGPRPLCRHLFCTNPG